VGSHPLSTFTRRPWGDEDTGTRMSHEDKDRSDMSTSQEMPGVAYKRQDLAEGRGSHCPSEPPGTETVDWELSHESGKRICSLSHAVRGSVLDLRGKQIQTQSREMVSKRQETYISSMAGSRSFKIRLPRDLLTPSVSEQGCACFEVRICRNKCVPLSWSWSDHGTSFFLKWT
jgi:hypothetical protein